ncbi:tripartite ATP-independent transporter DctP family solute receptor [Rhodopirellula rubra]|uniref:Tripartite ATP-independent transporter DctP family solute receptor n=1 Tax=Aporhodopirellula rubra TaxID=980271 RepID=A0A7W5H5T6_9BACT|nr:TRAP transporter substrate-binding protein [Aporhodopirellula rubra]MBB3206181.1 tripartite ATP-independent transporter DctP family solute receptor [Aporhodopirellula rubra]
MNESSVQLLLREPDETSLHRWISWIAVGLLLTGLFAIGGFALSLRSQKLRAGSGAERGRPLVLKLGHGLDTAHPVHLAMESMKERLEELSGGTVSIDIYPSSVLGSETQCIEQLQNGTLAMTKTSAASLENFIPSMSVFGFPYIFRDSDHYWAVLNGEIGNELLQDGEQKYLRGLCYYDAGSRNFYTKNTPVRTPDDLRGLKIRVQNSRTAIEMVKAMGGAPTPIAWGELYSALAQGTVDGAENNLPSFSTNKHYEVCRHFTLDGHTRIPDLLLVSTRIWNKLDPQVQAWLQQAATESSDYQRQLWDQMTLDAMDQVKSEGVTIHEIDIKSFAAKVAPMFENVASLVVRDLLTRISKVNAIEH